MSIEKTGVENARSEDKLISIGKSKAEARIQDYVQLKVNTTALEKMLDAGTWSGSELREVCLKIHGYFSMNFARKDDGHAYGWDMGFKKPGSMALLRGG